MSRTLAVLLVAAVGGAAVRLLHQVGHPEEVHQPADPQQAQREQVHEAHAVIPQVEVMKTWRQPSRGEKNKDGRSREQLTNKQRRREESQETKTERNEEEKKSTKERVKPTKAGNKEQTYNKENDSRQENKTKTKWKKKKKTKEQRNKKI